VKIYPGAGKASAVEAVRGISFSVEAGEFFGILGPNGAGKSTTIGCITTLVRPTSGRVIVNGIDTARNLIGTKSQIAVVPQNRNLDQALTVQEILDYHGRFFGLPAAERKARADRLLNTLCISEKARVRPCTLSGGIQQRVLLARAMMHNPKVLLLDEPTTGLDPQARRQFWEILGDLHKEGLTLILTTHNMEEADRLCQRLAIIDQGRLRAMASPAALKKLLPGGQILELAARKLIPMSSRLGQLAGVIRTEELRTVVDERGTEHIRIFLESGNGVVDRVIETVRSDGVQLESMSLISPTLEDVYIHLTGRELRE